MRVAGFCVPARGVNQQELHTLMELKARHDIVIVGVVPDSVGPMGTDAERPGVALLLELRCVDYVCMLGDLDMAEFFRTIGARVSSAVG